ncbi:hypothetical protein PMIN04_012459 [Paraphaeosphaeria minitans]
MSGPLRPRAPPITRVCRAIRAETVPIYYGSNKFDLKSSYYTANLGIYQNLMDALRGWIESIGIAQFKLVRNANVWMRDPGLMHEVLLEIALNNENLATADATVITCQGFPPGWRPFRPLYGLLWMVAIPSLRCAPFNHYIHRLMISEGILNPPMAFRPKSDVFTVISILEAAFEHHCCCCCGKPGTPSPCGWTAPSSYRRLSLTRSSPSPFCGEIRFVGASQKRYTGSVGQPWPVAMDLYRGWRAMKKVAGEDAKDLCVLLRG